MKPATREWVGKAEADFLSAYREYRARNRPNFDATCFFTQQCIEKYLKARLIEAGKPTPRTHDLPALLEAARRSDIERDRTEGHHVDLLLAVDHERPPAHPHDRILFPAQPVGSPAEP